MVHQTIRVRRASRMTEALGELYQSHEIDHRDYAAEAGVGCIQQPSQEASPPEAEGTAIEIDVYPLSTIVARHGPRQKSTKCLNFPYGPSNPPLHVVDRRLQRTPVETLPA
jgi:hypothetical protein